MRKSETKLRKRGMRASWVQVQNDNLIGERVG